MYVIYPHLRSATVLFATLFLLGISAHADPVSSGQASAHGHTYVTLGTGTAKVRGQTTDARETAIQSAIRAAVKQAYVDLIPQQQLVDHFSAIPKLLGLNSMQFIADFKVLAEFSQDQSYHVLIEATLTEAALLRQIRASGVILEEKKKQHLLILVSESHVADIEPRYWWRDMPSVGPAVAESLLQSALSQKGLTPVAHDMLPTDGTELLYQFGPNLNDKSARVLGQLYGADIVIYGAATADESANRIGSQQSYTADITLHLLETKSGNRINTLRASAAVLSDTAAEGGRLAIQTATQKLADPITQQLLNWNNRSPETTPIALQLNGKSYMSAFLAIKRVLSKVPGVKSIQPVEMQIDKAVLSIDYRHSADMLAKQLILNDFKSIGIRIVSVNDTIIIAECFKSEPVSASTGSGIPGDTTISEDTISP